MEGATVGGQSAPTCRLCGAAASASFVDLGSAPPCEALLTREGLDRAEAFYPLHVWVCPQCLLVQVPEYLPPEEIFTDDYPYFSSFSTSWVEHARQFAERAVERLGLGGDALVTEVASNDGYLLRHFGQHDVPVLGIEPTANTAAAAQALGIPTEVEFLGEETARAITARHGRADLVVANNVYAHIPDLLDFTAGLAQLLAPEGTLSLEFGYLARLIELNQFDTIYHEHFQYYTLLTCQRALATSGLAVVDVEELATHGGSLRVWAQHADRPGGYDVSPTVESLLEVERAEGLHELDGYTGFPSRVAGVKRDLVSFLLRLQADGMTVAGYGAPGKGNTLLNYCGIRPDLLPFTVDRNVHKHGMFLPGSRIPILDPGEIERQRPSHILVLPWNLRDEISRQLAFTAEWGAKLVFAVPSLEVVPAGEGAAADEPDRDGSRGKETVS